MYDSSADSPDCDGESDIDLSVYSFGSGLHLYFPFQEPSNPDGADKQAPYTKKNPIIRGPDSLLVLAAKMIAIHFPFEVVESGPVTVPEELQRLISFHSFPTDVEDIWLYSCLSSGGCSEFNRGEQLWADNAVKDCVQIGFHLSATVSNVFPFVTNTSDRNGRTSTSPSNAGPLNADSNQIDGNRQRLDSDNQADHFNRRGLCFEHRVSLTFDRRRITSCSCTCTFEMEERCTTYPQQNKSSDPGRTSFQGFQPESYYNDPYAFAKANDEWPWGCNLPACLARGCGRSSRLQSPSTLASNGRHRLANPTMGLDQTMKPYTDFVSIPGQNTAGTWCSHVVATCLMRIRQPEKVLLRAPISESLSKLSKEDLQKFAQNLICHVGPKKILPAAQRILDQLLDSTDNALKRSSGAPDPTAGGALGDPAVWCFDSAVLERKLRVTLRRFWTPKPSFLIGISSLTSDIPITFRSFVCMLNSLRSTEPNGLWELLCIISDMMRRQDNNGVLLLEIVTRCILDTKQFMLQWYTLQMNPCISPSSDPAWQDKANYISYWVCEEIVNLWRLACLNPGFRPQLSSVANRFPSGGSITSTCSKNTIDLEMPSNECWLLHQMARRLRAFHIYALQEVGIQVSKESILGLLGSRDEETDTPGNAQFGPRKETNESLSESIIHDFLGFKPALAACSLVWSADPPPTYGFSESEFRKIMPKFVGARVKMDAEHRFLLPPMFAGKLSGRNKCFHVETDHHWESDPISSGLFADLPIPHDEFEVAFAKFQAFDAHGYYEQALHWARYLACYLLYTSPEFLRESERIAFELVGQVPSVSSDANSPTRSTSNLPTEASTSRPTNAATCGQLNSRRSRKHGIPHPVTKQSTSTAANKSALNRSKKWMNSNGFNGRNSMEKNPKGSKEDIMTKKMALKWAEKVITWLDRVRYLMTCLIRPYRANTSETLTSSLTHRITSNDQTLLTTHQPYPRPVFVFAPYMAKDKKKDDANANKPNFISDTWMCIDIELAFRLGFCALTLIRPPIPSPILEIRLYDLETDLLSHLCSLPLHLTCPHVLVNIRTEAKRLSSGLSTGQKDIMAPFTLAIYLFHQLVGVLNGAKPRDVWFAMFSNVVEIHAENIETNTSDSEDMNPSKYPILATGALLAGSGLPLVVNIYESQSSNSSYITQDDGSVLITNLEQAKSADASLGFETILSVIGVKPRVQESHYPIFIEARRAHEDAIIDYLFRAYRNDVRKLDRILDRLLDPFYNPHFKCPPLWACLNLGPRDLMAYKIPKPNLCQDKEKSDTSADCVVHNSVKAWEESAAPIMSVPIPSEAMCSLLTNNSLPSEVVNISSDQQHAVDNLETNYPLAPNQQPLESPTSVLTGDQTIQSTPSGDCTPSYDQPNQLGVLYKGSVKLDSYIDTADLLQPSTSQTFPNRKQRSLSMVKDSLGPASTSEDTDTLSDSKIDALRCAALRDTRKRPQYSDKMTAVDTSAPETTSSDNSPAAIRRLLLFGKNRSAANLTESSDGGCAAIAERYYRLSHPSTSTNTELPNASATPTPNVIAHQTEPERTMPDSSGSVNRNGTKPLRPRSLVATSFAHMLASSSSFSSFSDDDDHIPNRPDIPTNLNNNATCESQSPSIRKIEATTSSSTFNQIHQQLDSGLGKLTSDKFIENVPSNKSGDEIGTIPSTSHGDIDWSSHLQRPGPQSLTMSMAYHCFKLAKSARELAGGQRRDDSFFVIEVNGDNTINRNLHLIAFQLGLYSLGLFNSLNPSWQSRTYSHYESWISRQVCEIGLPAACILFHSWRHHLTAVELLRIALQLSRENNRALVNVAAELCLASLSQCTTLKPLEICQALEQCEKHSSLTFERALVCVESNANKSPCGILPEIHFCLARGWFTIYQSAAKERDSISQSLHNQQYTSEVQATPLSSVTTEAIMTQPEVTTAAPFHSPHTIDYSTSIGSSSVPVRFPPYHPLDRTRMPPAESNIPLQANFPMQPQPWCNYNTTNPPPPNLVQQTALYPMNQYRAHLMMFHPTMVVNQNPTNHTLPTVMPMQPPGLFPTLPQPQQLGPLRPNSRPPFIIPHQAQMISSAQFEPNNFHYPYGIAPILDRGIPQMLPIGVNYPPPNYQAPFLLYSPSIWPPTMPIVPNMSFPIGSQSSNPSSSVPQNPTTTMSHFSSSFNSVPSNDPQTSCLNPMTVQDNQPQQTSIETVQSVSTDENLIIQPAISSTDNISRVSPIVNLSQRLASMSTASSSVVVHPSMSDQASSVSETDSVRRTESLIDGSNDDGSAAASRAPTSGEDRTTGTGSSDFTTTITSITKRLEFLNFKTTDYLCRSFSCAVCAIKKIFITQSGSVVSSTNFGSGSMNSTRPMRGKHNPQQNHRMGSFYQHRRLFNIHNNEYGSTMTGGDSSSTQYPNFTNPPNRPTSSSSWTLDPCLSTDQTNAISDSHVNGSQAVKTFDNQILWTFEVASRLGPWALKVYCKLVLQYVTCPFLMERVASTVITYFQKSDTLTMNSQMSSSNPTHLDFNLSSNPHPSHNPLDPAFNSMRLGHPVNCYLYPPNHVIPNYGSWAVHSMSSTDPNGSLSISPYQQSQLTNVNSGSSTTAAATTNNNALMRDLANPPTGGMRPQDPTKLINGPRMFPTPTPNFHLGQPSWLGYPNSTSTNTTHPNAHLHPCNMFGTSPNIFDADKRHLIECLINRTHTLFQKHIEQRLQYIGKSHTEWDELMDVILKAYNVHLNMPATDCNLSWDSLLSRIQHHPKCGSELWQRIITGIETADLQRSG